MKKVKMYELQPGLVTMLSSKVSVKKYNLSLKPISLLIHIKSILFYRNNSS